MKRHSIELFFDEATEQVLQGELRRMRDVGLPSPLLHWGMRPHVSVLLGSDMHEDAPDALAAFAAELAPLPVTLSVLGSFPGPHGTVILLPVVTRALLELHASAHARLGSLFADSDPNYTPDSWVPHCTQSIFLDDGELAATLRHLRTMDLPLAGQITSIGIHASMVDPTSNDLGRIGATEYPAVFALGG